MRGMMIDVGRKYIPLSYLYSLVNLLSYYKMNTLQVHLNDNGFRDFFHGNWNETYSAFRIESELFPGLTAKDGYYTKKGFHDFILYAWTISNANSFDFTPIKCRDTKIFTYDFVCFVRSMGHPAGKFRQR